MTDYPDCELCGSSRCKHGLCTNTGSPWTDGCPNSYHQEGFDKGYQCENCAEAAQERQIEDFYGGSGPQTDRERQIAAYKEFKQP